MCSKVTAISYVPQPIQILCSTPSIQYYLSKILCKSWYIRYLGGYIGYLEGYTVFGVFT